MMLWWLFISYLVASTLAAQQRMKRSLREDPEAPSPNVTKICYVCTAGMYEAMRGESVVSCLLLREMVSVPRVGRRGALIRMRRFSVSQNVPSDSSFLMFLTIQFFGEGFSGGSVPIHFVLCLRVSSSLRFTYLFGGAGLMWGIVTLFFLLFLALHLPDAETGGQDVIICLSFARWLSLC